MQSVIKNRDIEKRWGVLEEDGKYFAILKAGNHQEIGRSCPCDSYGAAAGYYKSWMTAAALAAAGPALGSVQKIEAEVPAPPQEEYLSCGAYKSHDRSSLYPEFSVFEEGGEHYFALHDKDGDVVLRSEGYTTEKARLNGIQSVINNRDIEERWSVIEDDGMYFSVLKAGNHQEIGRSCPYDDEAAAGAYWKGWLGAGALAAGAAMFGSIDPPKIEEKEVVPPPPPVVEEKVVVPPPPPPPVVEEKKVVPPVEKKVIATGKAVGATGAAAAAAAAGTAATVATKGKAGIPWAWLLPLLLLLLLGLMWWKGCFGGAIVGDPSTSSTTTTPPPANTTTPAVVPPVDNSSISSTNSSSSQSEVAAPAAPVAPPVEKDVAPTAPAKEAVAAPALAGTDCNCSVNSRLFKYSGTAKSVSKLGTNPEFGNSHGLSASQFYDKLRSKYANNPVDKNYLDNLFKKMGYGNGFSDASANLFSETEIERGTKGNLGYGADHGFGYYQLNTNQRDRQAFRIQAKNGCHVHFMKTCGNYFYYCKK